MPIASGKFALPDLLARQADAAQPDSKRSDDAEAPEPDERRDGSLLARRAGLRADAEQSEHADDDARAGDRERDRGDVAHRLRGTDVGLTARRTIAVRCAPVVQRAGLR